jgi:hypothetical protein
MRLAFTPAKVRLKVEVVMPRKRVASIAYREVCGENFRDILPNLSSDRPIDIPALELYADLWERIVPQHGADLR